MRGNGALTCSPSESLYSSSIRHPSIRSIASHGLFTPTLTLDTMCHMLCIFWRCVLCPFHVSLNISSLLFERPRHTVTRTNLEPGNRNHAWTAPSKKVVSTFASQPSACPNVAHADILASVRAFQRLLARRPRPKTGLPHARNIVQQVLLIWLIGMSEATMRSTAALGPCTTQHSCSRQRAKRCCACSKRPSVLPYGDLQLLYRDFKRGRGAASVRCLMHGSKQAGVRRAVPS